jgi:hypothetical protein
VTEKPTDDDRADRAAYALKAHFGEVHTPPGSQAYGDEGSDTFREAVVDLLTDLKHLLYRADYRLLLEELAAEATDRWAAEDDEEEATERCGEGPEGEPCNLVVENGECLVHGPVGPNCNEEGL